MFKFIVRSYIVLLAMIFTGVTFAASDKALLFSAKPLKKVPINISKQALASLQFELQSRQLAFDVIKDDYQKVYELITDPSLVGELLELRYAVNLAMDDFPRNNKFAHLGFELQPQVANKPAYYRLNYQQHNYLVSPERLFAISQFNHGSFVEDGLIERGFRRKDIQLLKSYVALTEPDREINALNLGHVQNYLPQLKQALGQDKIVDKAYVVHFFKTYGYYNQYFRQHVWLNWGKGLISQFDVQRQRILMSYLLERLDDNVSVVQTPNSSSIDSMKYTFQQEIADIRSGKIEQRIANGEAHD